MSKDKTAETILIVDDEEPVRRTFFEWLESAKIDCQLLTAADAETALVLANQHIIDLAILDWNLGAGNDGLRLLEDLYLFNPDIVAIMITGFAHQATPLDAMRLGVRDYLDKNQTLGRDIFLRAIQRQLDRIRPAKRQRRLHQSLVVFQEAVEKVLPLVQSASALNDPLPLPEAVGSLFRFLVRTTGARDGVLLIRSYDASRSLPESCYGYDATGKLLEVELIPFARSLASTVISLQQPYAIHRLEEAAHQGIVELQPFERNRGSLLAAPLTVAPGMHVVLELFDKQQNGQTVPFSDADRRLASAVADFGVEILRQGLAQRQMHQVLFDAVEAALKATASVDASLADDAKQRREAPPSPAILDLLRKGWSETTTATVDADETLRLAEGVRVLAIRHGPAAVRHCIRLVEDLRELLDNVTDAGASYHA